MPSTKTSVTPCNDCKYRRNVIGRDITIGGIMNISLNPKSSGSLAFAGQGLRI